MESVVGARRLLTINTGSSSLKAAVYRLREDTTETPELRAEASKIGDQGGGMSRYHLAAEALRRAGAASGLRPGDRGSTLISECEAAFA